VPYELTLTKQALERAEGNLDSELAHVPGEEPASLIHAKLFLSSEGDPSSHSAVSPREANKETREVLEGVLYRYRLSTQAFFPDGKIIDMVPDFFPPMWIDCSFDDGLSVRVDIFPELDLWVIRGEGPFRLVPTIWAKENILKQASWVQAQ